MKKFKVTVSKVYSVEHNVLAEDEVHAREIASEISDLLEPTMHNFYESQWWVMEVNKDSVITYTPEQEYLK